MVWRHDDQLFFSQVRVHMIDSYYRESPRNRSSEGTLHVSMKIVRAREELLVPHDVTSPVQITPRISTDRLERSREVLLTGLAAPLAGSVKQASNRRARSGAPVSYTHLTLPTIYSV